MFCIHFSSGYTNNLENELYCKKKMADAPLAFMNTILEGVGNEKIIELNHS